jgi:hypothetical protein
MLEWIRKQDGPVLDIDDDWTLYRPELSLPIWKAMEATDWRHLAYPGGLLDQPDWLIHDLYILAWRKAINREHLKSPAVGARPLFRRK